jgi:hypothetical protein
VTSPGRTRYRLRRSHRRTAALLLLGVVALVLTGCARVQVALGVASDDTVTGEVVVATPSKGANDKGPQLRVPPRLSDEVQVEPYTDGEYVGSRLTFRRLTFEQFNTLTDVSPQAEGRYRLNMNRIGSQVVLTGLADLNSVGVDKADFQLKISEPGQVDNTNGDFSRGTVSWQFTPGRVNDIRASLLYDDPQAPSPLRWTLVLGIVVGLVGFGVIRQARRDRNAPASGVAAR